MNTNKEYIGQELKIQRDYYNKSNNIGYALDDTYSEKSKSLAEDLEDYLFNHFEYMFQDEFKPRENKGERSKDPAILSYLENNTSKSKKECNYNSYYLRIYCIFKLYGFLDDFEIFKLLQKYNIVPKNDKSKIESNRIKKECINEYKNNLLKRFIPIEYPVMAISNSIIVRIVEEKEKRNILELADLDLPTKVNQLILPCNGNISDMHKVEFHTILKQFIKQVKDISKEEQRYLSLKLGKESCFIEELLQDKVKYVTFETLSKMLKYLKLENTDYWIILDELKKSNLGTEDFIFEYPRIELVKAFENILKIYE